MSKPNTFERNPLSDSDNWAAYVREYQKEEYDPIASPLFTVLFNCMHCGCTVEKKYLDKHRDYCGY